MTLTEYLKQHPNETLAGLATRLGLHRGHLHKIATGERGWNSETALAIQNGTDGLVTPNDLARTRRLFLAREKREQRTRRERA
jgi:DNA-binding transcriptional regulator YdaS (Cro superfamily)